MKELRQALHLRAGTALKDIPAHHGVDLGRAMKGEGAKEPAPTEPAGWSVPVLTTNALTNEGVGELLETIEGHGAWLETSGQLQTRRRDRAATRIRDVVDRELRRVAWRSDETAAMLKLGVERISEGAGTPYSAAREILKRLLR